MNRVRLLLLLSIVTICTSGRTHGASLRGVGDIPGSIYRSFAYGISGDGQIVVGSSITGNGEGAPYVWRRDIGMVPLFADTRGLINAASENGDVLVGAAKFGSFYHASRFDLTVGGAWNALDNATSATEATSVSADGSTVSLNRTWRPLRWNSATGLTELGSLDPSNRDGNALAISADGKSIAGWSIFQNQREAFLWTEANGMVGLGFPGDAYASQANGISANGEVLVGVATYPAAGSIRKAFRWTASSGFVTIDSRTADFTISEASDTSADGSIIVGRANLTGGSEAFIWDEQNGMRSLRSMLQSQGVNLAGWELWYATGISDNGKTVVGWGQNPHGDIEGYVAVLDRVVPEPNAFFLTFIGVISLLVARGAKITRTMRRRFAH